MVTNTIRRWVSYVGPTSGEPNPIVDLESMRRMVSELERKIENAIAYAKSTLDAETGFNLGRDESENVRRMNVRRETYGETAADFVTRFVAGLTGEWGKFFMRIKDDSNLNDWDSAAAGLIWEIGLEQFNAFTEKSERAGLRIISGSEVVK